MPSVLNGPLSACLDFLFCLWERILCFELSIAWVLINLIHGMFSSRCYNTFFEGVSLSTLNVSCNQTRWNGDLLSWRMFKYPQVFSICLCTNNVLNIQCLFYICSRIPLTWLRTFNRAYYYAIALFVANSVTRIKWISYSARLPVFNWINVLIV